MRTGLCNECGSDRIEVVSDTVWCPECGALIADTLGGMNCDISISEEGHLKDGSALSWKEIVLLREMGLKIVSSDLPALRGWNPSFGRRMRPKAKCEWPGCSHASKARGLDGLRLCYLHYGRWKAGIDMDAPVRARGHNSILGA